MTDGRPPAASLDFLPRCFTPSSSRLRRVTPGRLISTGVSPPRAPTGAADFSAISLRLSPARARERVSGADGCPPLHLCGLTPRPPEAAGEVKGSSSARRCSSPRPLLWSEACTQPPLTLHRCSRRLREGLRQCTAICNAERGIWGGGHTQPVKL